MVYVRTLAVLVLAGYAAAAQAQTVEGRFGRGLSLHNTSAHAPTNPIYTVIPITVECWAKVEGKGGQQVLVANEVRTSGTHWEIFVEKGTGFFGASLPQWKPEGVKSKVDVADGQWHYLAMVFDGKVVKLYVDGKVAAEQGVERVFKYPDSSPLTIGHVEGVAGQAGGVIDEVRISRVARVIDRLPDAAFAVDGDTIALWHFDEEAGKSAFADASKTNNAVVLSAREGRSSMFANDNRWQQMEFGPFFSATFAPEYPVKNVVGKGVAVRVGKEKSAAVLFDTELLRPAVAWRGEFVALTPGREGLAGHPTIPGNAVWGTKALPGWMVAAEDDVPRFPDPRPEKMGPLPAEHGRYRGLYVHGDRVVFSYSVAQVDVLETHDFEVRDGVGVFGRTLELGARDKLLALRLVDLPPGDCDGASSPPYAVHLRTPDGVLTTVALAGAEVRRGVRIWHHNKDRGPVFIFPPSAQPSRYRILVFRGNHGDEARFAELARNTGEPIDLSSLTRGGAARYPAAVVTKGVLGDGKQAYTVDTFTAPEENPWKSFLRFGGHDFFANGDIAVCSVSGDVWVVSGVDEKLERLAWRRFATGLHQPLGLRIVDEKVYVLGRDQITRLHDLNGDGEADFYENFNNDAHVTTNGHAYATNLETDPEGNFYYTRCADNTAHGGTLLRVSKDGSKLEVFATGLRNPNGMGVSPKGVVTEADNQGEWVPASRLDVVSRGEFLGYVPMSKMKEPPKDAGRPLCWMPQNVDNSSGGQCWVTSERWGPFKDYMLHTSYGAAALLLVMEEEVNGQVQGGVVKFPLAFATGVMRGRFSPKDGQLYVSGMRGWQTSGARSGALQRVRYTGKPVYMPASINVHRNGVRLGFTCKLDAEAAGDRDAYTVLQWNYKWVSSYGSRHWSVKEPGKQGYDEVEVRSVKVLADGKSVFLEIPDIKAVMQMQIGFKIAAEDGTSVKGDVHNTIHELGPRFVQP